MPEWDSASSEGSFCPISAGLGVFAEVVEVVPEVVAPVDHVWPERKTPNIWILTTISLTDIRDARMVSPPELVSTT